MLRVIKSASTISHQCCTLRLTLPYSVALAAQHCSQLLQACMNHGSPLVRHCDSIFSHKYYVHQCYTHGFCSSIFYSFLHFPCRPSSSPSTVLNCNTLILTSLLFDVFASWMPHCCCCCCSQLLLLPWIPTDRTRSNFLLYSERSHICSAATSVIVAALADDA